MLERFLSSGKLEKKVIGKIKDYLNTLCSATQCLKGVLINEKIEETYCIESLEREADYLKREIISLIYEGAFLPYIRPNLCAFIEITEKAFNYLKICALNFRYLRNDIYKEIKKLCIKVADINVEMCEILMNGFDALSKKNNLREKNLAIRICEKKVDEIKLDINETLRNSKTGKYVNFWEGKIIAEFVDALVSISDIIEDASDYLYILELSLK